MKKLNLIALGTCLVALLATSLLVISAKTAPRNVSAVAIDLEETTIYDYETSLGATAGSDDTNSIRLSYDPMGENLVIAFFESGDASAYVAENVTEPIGTHTLQRRSLYDDASGSLYIPANSITIEIYSLSTEEVEFLVIYSSSNQSKYIAPKVEETSLQHRYGVCSNPNGTGACDQVHTNRDWWRCFVCCFYGGGCGA